MKGEMHKLTLLSFHLYTIVDSIVGKSIYRQWMKDSKRGRKFCSNTNDRGEKCGGRWKLWNE